MTKSYEEYIRTTVAEAAILYQQTEPRGEFVLVLEGLAAWNERQPSGTAEVTASDDGAMAHAVPGSVLPSEQVEDPAVAMLRGLLREGKSLKDAVRQCARKTGRGRNELYPLALALMSDTREEMPGESDIIG